MISQRNSGTYWTVRLLLTAALIVGLGCSVDDLQHQGRYCSVQYPCPEGFACQGQACISTADAALPRDAAKDARQDALLDGPAIPPERIVNSEGGVDLQSSDSLKPDTVPQPDLGCTGGKISCGGSCVDPLTDSKHCNGCFKACPASADRCQQGLCHCGDFKPLCKNGLNCKAGACTCVVGGDSLCQGCCASDVCFPGNTVALCGLLGVACQTCTATNSCLTATCSATGTCTAKSKPDGQTCTGGRCYQGSCCTGCYSSMTQSCHGGTIPVFCGKGGVLCEDCMSQQQQCINYSCQ